MQPVLNLNNPEFIKELNRHLNASGVIAFPTDTVWGLGALPCHAGADALFAAKRRPHERHLIIMSDSLEHIKPYMSDYPTVAFDCVQCHVVADSAQNINLEVFGNSPDYNTGGITSYYATPGK